jgi:hypothetical protein
MRQIRSPGTVLDRAATTKAPEPLVNLEIA